ncbi:protein kinase family protein [Kribbella sp. CA-293567]|uniref:protein kinase family protein n=1 Tax=Kribbella sp. CA-293567 TaxID=3002436 RepID=UPI0022DE76A4|nr:protein kinase family protein [Kribbella sp. CA-293567]WBQ05522.1 protein kinase family protein [Kribbella sp. CA-293567]
MSNQTVSPGALLAGRYRIAELLAEIDGARVWRAVDEVLSRAVVVDVLPVGDPRTDLLFDAARRAAAAADPRFLRVLDCDMHEGVTYCVREWAGGRPLERMLGAGPLTGQQAGWLAREVSEALENLHRTGHSHGSISPSTVVVTDAGAIKVVGLATEAALRSTGPGTPEEDVRALGELLYASLTGRWPGPAPAWGLQPAPVEHGRLMSPRQVRAGVPRSLDDISDRLLGDPPRHHSVPITSAAGLSAALSGVIGSSHEPPSQMDETVAVARQNGSVDDATQIAPAIQPPPALDPPVPHYQQSAYAENNGHAAPQPSYATAAETQPVRRQPSPPQNGNGRRKPPSDEPKQRGSWGGRILILLAVLALLSVVAMAQFLVKGAINKDQGTDGKTSAPPPANTPPPAASGTPVKIAGAKDFDPEPQGNGEEHPEDVGNTYDGKASTTWTTMSYKRRPDLGGTKDGVGIVYDLGALTDVSKVTVNLVGEPTDLSLMIPKADPAVSAPDVSGWKAVASLEKQGAQAALTPTAPVKTRYVLVWLTSLPKEGSGYRGEISEVTVQK